MARLGYPTCVAEAQPVVVIEPAKQTLGRPRKSVVAGSVNPEPSIG